MFSPKVLIFVARVRETMVFNIAVNKQHFHIVPSPPIQVGQSGVQEVEDGIASASVGSAGKLDRVK